MYSELIYHNVPTPPATNIPLAVAAPDGGFLYAGVRSINYISAEPADAAEKSQVKIMSTRFNIIALDVSPMWGKGRQPFAIVGDDLSVQVWDCMMGGAVSGHKAHQHQHEARNFRGSRPFETAVLMSYMSNGNILSIDASDLVIYCVASNTFCRRPTFIPSRNHHPEVLRCSPYNNNVFALGTTLGAVLVCDLLKMSIVYKFSGHKNCINGLAWRQVSLPFEEEKLNLDTLSSRAEQWRSRKEDEVAEASSKPKPKPPPLVKSKPGESDDPFDIYNFDHLECEFGAPVDARRKSSDDCGDDFVGLEKPAGAAALDFVEACESIKADIISNRSEAVGGVEVTLDDCQPTKPTGPLSDASNISNNDSATSNNQNAALPSDSTEGSLEVIQYSSSSDDAVIVDGDAAKPKREVLHHIYHRAEVHAPETSQIQMNPEPDLKTALVEESSTESIISSSINSSIRPDILLVSIDAEEVVMIWNTNTGAHAGKNYSNGKSTDQYCSVMWLNDRTIVSLGRHQLSFWSLVYDRKMLRYKINKDKQHKCGTKDILSFATKCSKQQLWVCRNNRTTGLMDPLTGHIITNYSSLVFGVRAMVECPDDMNKIALGCSDRRVAFFDLSKLATNGTAITTSHIGSNVYSLAWSPDCLQLACGTYDGSVAILDVETMKVKRTIQGPQKKEVYSLVWQENYIYFVVNRKLCFVDLSRPKTEVTVLNLMERTCFLSIRGSFLFLGSEDGVLQLHENKPDQIPRWGPVLRQSALLSRYITDITWNPLESNVFAVVGHEKYFLILEFLEADRNWRTLHTFTASNPKGSITSLKWSNYQKNLLLTFHIEGKVCMWDTHDPKKPPLTITYHCPMWCGMLLPSDENIVMCSGKSISLELINIKDALAGDDRNICSKVDGLLNVKWATKSLVQPYAPPTRAEVKKIQRKDRRRRRVHGGPREVQEVIPDREATNDPNDQKIQEMFDSMTLNQKPEPSQSTNECRKCKENESSSQAPESVPTTTRTCLYLAQKDLNKNALGKLAIVLTEDAEKIDKSVLLSKLFGTKAMAKELIEMELTNLKQSNSKDIAPLCLTISTFKLRKELEEHIANKTLTEGHLAVAPSVSYVFWRDCCEAYAKQMEEKGYIMHAATYRFSLGQHREAIDLLLANEYFKEALVHARISLPATDPKIKTIINQWLERLEKTGNFGAAALICVLDNEMMRGYMYLRKFHNCKPEIADLMAQIKRLGQLGEVLDGCAPGEPPALNGEASDHVA
ncbi:protein rigor mortis [Drosophila miranda]|uniref:protein rigor mortis n=1 Tax=Drosophila miranda TaxID=7229 RepID=UPI0007E5F6B1|nr:protein rigor mortis [Drosophila miranda]